MSCSRRPFCRCIFYLGQLLCSFSTVSIACFLARYISSPFAASLVHCRRQSVPWHITAGHQGSPYFPSMFSLLPAYHRVLFRRHSVPWETTAGHQGSPFLPPMSSLLAAYRRVCLCRRHRSVGINNRRTGAQPQDRRAADQLQAGGRRDQSILQNGRRRGRAAAPGVGREGRARVPVGP